MIKNRIQDLTLASVFASIIIMMTFIPQIGYITLGVVSLTLIHIPVLIGVFLLPKKYSVTLGLIFGLGSLLKALIQPVGPLDPVFVMPWVSVLPRVLFALIAAYLYDFLKKIDTKFKHSNIVIFGVVTLITLFGIYFAFDAIGDATGWSKAVLVPMSLVLITLFVTAYYTFINSSDKNRILIPSILIISTVIHTVLVLSALVIFETAFVRTLLPDANLLGLVYTVAVTNGLIEAFLAAMIGTPIILALLQLENQK